MKGKELQVETYKKYNAYNFYYYVYCLIDMAKDILDDEYDWYPS